MKRKNTLTYWVFNPEDYKEYKAMVSIQELWSNRINNVVIAKSEQVPRGHVETVHEGLLPYLARLFGW